MVNTNIIQSVDRALETIDILKNYPDGIGVTELSDILGVSKSTAFRILNSLNKRGYVYQDEISSRYFLGLKLLELGELVSSRLDIKKIVKPFLEKLSNKTNETTHLAILDGIEVVYIDKIESEQTLRMFSNIGKRGPIHCTGLGKAMLAYEREEKINDIINKLKLTKFTENTITDPKKLKKELENIRNKGYAVDDEEHEKGIKCAAAPILDYKKNVVGGISIACPIFRLDDRKFAEMVDLVLDASIEVSKLLGYEE